MSSRSQSGNVLFLILIAVALFAALSYAITSSTRNSSSDSQGEKSDLSISRILSYISIIQASVTRLTLMNNVSAHDLYFNSNNSKRVDGSIVNNPIGSPVDPKLYVFHAKGGGVPDQIFSDVFNADCSSCIASDWQSGHWAIRWLGSSMGTTAGDLAFGIPGLDKTTCSKINSKHGIIGIPSNIGIPVSGIVTGTPPPILAMPSGADSPMIEQKDAFCIQISGQARYTFFFVIQTN